MCDHTTLPPSTRPASAPSASGTRTFPGRLDQIRQVRALMRRMLSGSPGADDAVLLISELATNACIHTASGRPGGTFTVRIHNFPTHVCAEVEDQGSTWDGNLAAQPPHGLYLLRALASESGTYRSTCGWTTWFTIAETTMDASQP